MGIVSAQDLNDNSDFDDYLSDGLGTNSVSIGDNAISQDTSLDTKYGYEDSSDKIESMKNSINDLESNRESPVLEDGNNEIIVNDWEELQYYCSLEDRNYTLKLKENTNYYPLDPVNSSYQIIIKNNVSIFGSEGAYIGDSSPDARNITYAPMLTEDDSGIGVHIENVTFKWIATDYQSDGVFLTMAGNTFNSIKNCYFYNITTNIGHSSIVYIRRGDAALENCTFINCTTDFGCVSIYDPRDNPYGVCKNARMTMDNCCFENNYAKTEPGCVNNCGILIVNNTSFSNNSAYWWAGAIHTHSGANTTIYYSNFTDNVAGWNGGALYAYGWLQVYNSTFKRNKCFTNNGGGAIGACYYIHSPYIHIEDTVFEDNENACWEIGGESTTGTGRGGAISIMDDGLLEVYNSTFIKNSASIGTAICALEIDYSGKHQPLDIKLIGNKFINHTRVGDVLNIRVNDTSTCIIEDNYYLNNSIEFSNLNLSSSEIDGVFYFDIDINLSNPNCYDSNILEKCLYDIYLNGTYFKTVNNTKFSLSDIDKTWVYIHPSIGNINSNEVYVYIKKNSTVSINVSDIEYGEIQTINLIVDPSEASGNLTVLVNNVSYGINITNPYLNLGILPVGEYNVTVTYNGDLEYYSSTNNSSFLVNKKINNNTILDINVPSDATSASFAIDMANATGSLTVTINNKNYSKELVDGKATVDITGLPAGTYNALISYSGDDNFAPVTKNATITIKAIVTKLSAGPVTATYNVVKNLVITLTDINGKALANKKVAIKVESISKTLTTNSKGQVSINIATLVPKTYTATVNFAGDSSYTASTLNPKVVVKKAKVQLVAKAKTFKAKVKTKKYTVTLKNNKGKVMKKVKLTLKVGKKTYKATTNSKGKATFKITKLTKKGKKTATVKFAGIKYFKALSKKVKITVK